jgi:hypothetical protein
VYRVFLLLFFLLSLSLSLSLSFSQGPWALRTLLPVVNMSNNRLPTLLVSTTQHALSLVVLTAQEVLTASAAAQLLEQTRNLVEQAVCVCVCVCVCV